MRLAALPCNFVITAQPREVYTDQGTATGAFAPRWQKQTPHWMDVVLSISKVSPAKGAPAGTKVRYESTITKCRLGRMYDAKVEDVTFDTLCNELEKKLKIKIRR